MKKRTPLRCYLLTSGPALEIAKSVGDCSTPLWEMQAKRIRSIFPFTMARLSSILGCASIRRRKSPTPPLIAVWSSQDIRKNRMDPEGTWAGSKTFAVGYEQILMFHRIGVVYERYYQRSYLFTLSHSLGGTH